MTFSGLDYKLFFFFDGHIAVCGFFIISGFLVTRSYITTKSIKYYFIKRMKRILPAYIFVILFSALSLSVFSTLSFYEYFTTIEFYRYLISNITFMNFLGLSLPGVFNGMEVNGALWTIKIEVAFYIIVPLIVTILLKLKTLGKQNIFLLGLYITGVLYRIFCLFLANRTDLSLFSKFEHQLPGFLQYFSFGIFALLNYNFLRKHEKKIIIPAIFLFALHFITKTEILMPISLGIIVMFIAFNFRRLNSIGKEIDFSYGIYIYHFPIIRILVLIGVYACNKYIAILLVLGSVFSLSYISWQFLERKVLGK